MPALANNNQYPHFHYSYLGNSSSEALIHLITHPVESISMLFTNHNNSLGGDFVKMELHVLLLFSGLLFLIKKPHYLLMLVPIYFQKLFHDPILWEHYILYISLHLLHLVFSLQSLC